MLEEADVQRCFASEYVTARQQFLDRAERMDLEIESVPISKKGPHDEILSTDYIWFGAKDANKLILHTSGVHGVEGFPGSAAAVHILDGLRKKQLVLPDDCAIAFAHIINPWGMAWLRRVQEGQYTRPKSLQYGGGKMAEASRNFIGWCERNLTNVQQIVWIDFHTGLGPFGVDSLLVGEDVDEAVLKHRYGSRIQPLDPKKGVAYKIRGGIQAGIEARFPEKDWTSITQEFGTIKPIPLLRLARAENRLTQWSGKPPLRLLSSKERREMLDAFNPRSLKWRKMILERSQAIIVDAITHLSEE